MGKAPRLPPLTGAHVQTGSPRAHALPTHSRACPGSHPSPRPVCESHKQGRENALTGGPHDPGRGRGGCAVPAPETASTQSHTPSIPRLNSTHVLSNRNEEVKAPKGGVFSDLGDHPGKGAGGGSHTQDSCIHTRAHTHTHTHTRRLRRPRPATAPNETRRRGDSAPSGVPRSKRAEARPRHTRFAG